MDFVLLPGHLGVDPESKYTSAGDHVVTFSFATRDYNGSPKWHKIVCFNKTADIASKYLKKGSAATLVGNLRYENWSDADGNKRHSTKINVTHITFMGSSKIDQNESPVGELHDAVTKAASYEAKKDVDYSQFDDDIPF